MKNLEITEKEYKKVTEIISKYKELYFEKYSAIRTAEYIAIIGREINYTMLKEIEEETNLSGWGVIPTIKEIDGIEFGVKIRLYHKE